MRKATLGLIATFFIAATAFARETAFLKVCDESGIVCANTVTSIVVPDDALTDNGRGEVFIQTGSDGGSGTITAVGNITSGAAGTSSANDVTFGNIQSTAIGKVSPGDATFNYIGMTDSESYFRPSNEVRNWYLTGNTKSVTTEESLPTGIFFSTDGTRMFLIGSNGDSIDSYDLSPAWDVTTAILDETVSVAGQETFPQDLYISNDGLKLFVAGSTGDDVTEYTLLSPWVITGLSFVTQVDTDARGEILPTGVTFKPDGSKMYVVGQTLDTVEQFDLLTPFSVATASYVQSFSVATQETFPVAIQFNDDGTRMYIIGSTGDDINEYRLTTAWDISTAAIFSTSFTYRAETLPGGLYYNETAEKAFFVGSTLDTVIEMGTDKQIKYFGDSFVLDSQVYIDERAEFNGEVYLNQPLTSISTLSGTSLALNGPISGATTGAFASTVTETSTTTTSPTNGFVTTTPVSAVGTPVRVSPPVTWIGSAWDVDDATARANSMLIFTEPVSANTTSTSMVFRNVTINGSADTTEHMRIMSGGNVGIGTATPTSKLTVIGSLTATDATFQTINDAKIGNITPGDATFTNIYSSGNIGVGTTNPSARFEVDGGSASFQTSGDMIKINAESSSPNAGSIRFGNNENQDFGSTANGAGTVGFYWTDRNADSASSIGGSYNAVNLSTAGAKIFRWQAASVEKAYIAVDGSIYSAAKISGAGDATFGSINATKIGNTTAADATFTSAVTTGTGGNSMSDTTFTSINVTTNIAANGTNGYTGSCGASTTLTVSKGLITECS